MQAVADEIVLLNIDPQKEREIYKHCQSAPEIFWGFSNSYLLVVQESYDDGYISGIELQREVLLKTLDTLWKDHLVNMNKLSSAVNVRSFGHRNLQDRWLQLLHLNVECHTTSHRGFPTALLVVSHGIRRDLQHRGSVIAEDITSSVDFCKSKTGSALTWLISEGTSINRSRHVLTL
ncbi:uncharacterized protein [Miscanthus floridulus]|uniref:uncharacterized protein isoform X1 n=1 Tax=Miscanthus floridulus TaxID=154761 RepID=UPI003459BA8A